MRQPTNASHPTPPLPAAPTAECAVAMFLIVLAGCGGGDAAAPPIKNGVTVSAAAPTPAAVTATTPTPSPGPAASAAGTALVSFDETPSLTVSAIGSAGATIDLGPPGGSGNALKITRPATALLYAGAFVTLPAIPFTSTRKTITARVYSPTAGVPFIVKAEYGTNLDTGETAPKETVVAGWQTLTWVFNNIDLTKTYTVFSIFPNLNTLGKGEVYYVDDITLAPVTATAPAPDPTVDQVLANFDETTALVVTEFGGAGYAVEPAIAGGSGSGKALKITRPAGGLDYAGAYVGVSPIPFAANRKTVTALVYSPKAGIPIKAKAEYADNQGTGETASSSTVVVGWQTLTWVFSNADLSKSYTRFTILPDLGTVGTGQVYYFDDVKLLAAPASSPSPSPSGPTTIATLDEAGASLTGFEGCYDSKLVADPAGGTNLVGKVIKPGSGVPFYCGSTVVTVANGGFATIPFTATDTKMTVRVWSPDAGIPVRLKVEDIGNPSKSVETEATTTVANGWQTLTFDFANAASGTPVLNLANTYNKASIFFDFGKLGTGKTYYFDDITFTPATGAPTVLVTFDEKNYNNTQSQPSILLGFDGAENSTLVGASDGLPPDGAKTGKAAKVVKNAGLATAGTAVQRKVSDAVPTIPFATGATKMSVRVYSAFIGMRVHLKVEQAGRPDYNSEVDAFTTLANTWETLVFDFGPAGKHYVPNGPGPNGYETDPTAPAYQPTAQLDVTRTFNKVNIFFDYGLGDAGYDAMPGTRTYYFDDIKFVGP